MKSTRTFALILALMLALGTLSSCSSGDADNSKVAELEQKVADLEAQLGSSAFDAARFPTWFEEEGTWRTLANANAEQNYAGGFVTDTAGKPSNADLEAMLHMASLAVTSGGQTDWYMVAVTDAEEQKIIIGDNGGTSEGTVTVLVFSERVLREDVRTDDVARFQPDRGYYDAGIVTGYLNVAAVAMGYGTHMYMTPALEGVNGFNNGERGLDADKYLAGTTYVNGSTHETLSTENMKYVNAVVIGTPIEGAMETGVTTKDFPDNWSIWTE